VSEKAPPAADNGRRRWTAWISPELVAVLAAVVLVVFGTQKSDVSFRNVGGAIAFVLIVGAIAGGAAVLVTRRAIARIEQAAQDTQTGLQNRLYELVASTRWKAGFPQAWVPQGLPVARCRRWGC